MVRVNESAHTANECWGTWKEIGNVLQLNHTHWDDNHKQGSFYYSPLPETYLPANSISDLEIVSLSGSSMQLKYVTDDNRVVGYKVTSIVDGYTERSIFLPAAGYRWNNTFYRVGVDGHYWSSTPSNSGAEYFFFNRNNVNISTGGNRANGHSVRCVKE